MRSPFSLYTKKLKSGLVWYVRFYNPQTGKYSISRSTGIPCNGKRGNQVEAYKVATEIRGEDCSKKAQKGVFQALLDIRAKLPFPVLGIDSDNGSEFIKDKKKKYRCSQILVEICNLPLTGDKYVAFLLIFISETNGES